MDYITLTFQMLGGALGALVATALPGSRSLGPLGAVVIGCVGGPLGGLILTGYLDLAPAGLADGTIAGLPAVLAQIVSSAAGGAILATLIGFLKRLVRS